MKTVDVGLTLVKEYEGVSNTDIAERIKSELSEIKFQFINGKTVRVVIAVEVV